MSERGSGWRGCWMVAVSTDTSLATAGPRAQAGGSNRCPAEEAGRGPDQQHHDSSGRWDVPGTRRNSRGSVLNFELGESEYTNLGKSLRAETPVMRA